MPLPLQNIYTGKGTGVLAPTGERIENAAYNANNLVNRGIEQSYNDAIRRQKELLELGDITPEEYLSSDLMLKQGKAIETFEKDLADRLNKNDGRLSQLDYIDIQRNKNKYTQQQAEWLLKDKLVKDQMKEYWNNQSDYSPETLERYQQYVEGKLPEGQRILVDAPVDWSNVAYDFYRKGGLETEQGKVITQKGDKVYEDFVETYPSEEEQKAKLEGWVTGKPKLIKDISDRFLQLPEDDQQQYLDNSDNDQDALLDYQWDWMKANGLVRTTKKSKDSQKPASSRDSSPKTPKFAVVDNLQTVTTGSGRGIKMLGNEKMNLSPDKLFFGQMDVPDEIASFQPLYVLDGVVEGIVKLKDPIEIETEVSRAEYNQLPSSKRKSVPYEVEGEDKRNKLGKILNEKTGGLLGPDAPEPSTGFRYYRIDKKDEFTTVATLSTIQDELFAQFDGLKEALDKLNVSEESTEKDWEKYKRK